MSFSLAEEPLSNAALAQTVQFKAFFWIELGQQCVNLCVVFYIILIFTLLSLHMRHGNFKNTYSLTPHIEMWHLAKDALWKLPLTTAPHSNTVMVNVWHSAWVFGTQSPSQLQMWSFYIKTYTRFHHIHTQTYTQAQLR